MGLFLVTNAGTKTVRDGINQVVCAGDDAAAAKLAAAALFTGDSSWAGATTTELVDTTTVNTAAAMIGWRFKISVSGEGHAEVLGVATTLDTLDEIGTALATALNLLTNIAGAAYVTATQTLTIAETTDTLGDQTVTVLIQAPVLSNQGGQYSGDSNLGAAFTSSLTHEGIAGAALTLVFNADTMIVPLVLAQGVGR